MNFSEFLFAEKMKKAQKLICDSSNKIKIQDIAEKLVISPTPKKYITKMNFTSGNEDLL
ncbi:MAG TPA: hypothetical protein PK733_07630 [Clostridiales bacterium]|nr:hypothetical protein [Clostridiales bacterium]